MILQLREILDELHEGQVDEAEGLVQKLLTAVEEFEREDVPVFLLSVNDIVESARYRHSEEI